MRIDVRYIFFLFAFTGLFPCFAESRSVNIDENSTIVCFGDSLTYGHGANSETES